MGAIKPITKEMIPDIAAAATGQIGQIQLAKRTGLGESKAEQLQRVARMQLAEFAEEFRAEAQKAIKLGIERIEATIPTASCSQAAVAVGILSDKIGSLAAPKQAQSVHLHLHGGTEAEKRRMLGAALGAAIRPVASGAHANKAKRAEPIEITPADACIR